LSERAAVIGDREQADSAQVVVVELLVEIGQQQSYPPRGEDSSPPRIAFTFEQGHERLREITER
jgi:5-deoxy-D-glucuronate isomerase